MFLIIKIEWNHSNGIQKNNEKDSIWLNFLFYWIWEKNKTLKNVRP